MAERMRRRPGSWACCAVLAAGASLVGCTSPEAGRTPQVVTPSGSATPSSPTPSSPTPSGEPTPSEEPTPPGVPGPALPEATAEPQDVLTGLAAPWDLAFLPGGAVVVTQRDAAQVLLLTADGVRTLTGPGADELVATTATRGEGGLLGVAVPPDDAATLLLYRTTQGGNEVVRTALDAAAGTLGPLAPVLTGIPAASNHDGGRIAFGPDGMLYVATGDASVPGAAQDPTSLAGKILRVTADGRPAPGNPTPDSPVWSLGHRNVQGLGWDDDERLVASEFGQNRLDELNVVVPGANHGWPEVEGAGGAPTFADPVVTWTTDEASPSGLAVTTGSVYVAALRGERLWAVPWADGAPAGDPVAHLVGALGRLRHVAVGPDGALWVLTNNTDGRGDPRSGDDRLVRLLPP
ncbi:PQQ-dependent sugar dehydrogenase [Cellulomonas carbonis]|uniref:Glucose sorbosone dehydrogenase n=1 Tax=Cellulomonas carbonis T26 TaxID=947969 RepID=A0A0A0BV63_9CELL|nr:PQQ-dependent sugar dehydrogenase [Cellulomonas carbonis]KGM11059.1 glucose sorbosone dehydrogenase [Cellulomonas carbonis T26]GGC16354.1 oxidoreductase [Cellulomonas carbonis]